MKAQAEKTQRRKLTIGQKWLVISVPLLVVLIISVFVVKSGYNPAREEARSVLQDVHAGLWYCGNGAPRGVANKTPWWEEIYVSQDSIDEMAEHLVDHLAERDYLVDKKYIEDSNDNASLNQGKTYWEIEGTREQFRVEGRITAHSLTVNNCFLSSSEVNKEIKPEDYSAVLVIQFEDISER